MADYFNFNINPNKVYGHNPVNDDWDFDKREGEMDRQFDQGLNYKLNVTLNLRKQNPK